LPNFVWANFINFFATNRALYMFSRYLATGKWMKWDHTTHAPPNQEELMAFRRRIGDMLVEKRIISFAQLEGAIREQQTSGRLLGDILMRKGAVSEDELVQTLGMQLRISTREIDPYDTPLELLRLLPRDFAVLYSVYPVELKDNKLIVAASALPSREELSRMEATTGLPIELCLTTKSTLSFSIQRGYDRLQQQERNRKVRLGQLLLDRNLVTRDQLHEALRRQRQTYARLGDILLDEFLITSDQLKLAFKEHADCPGELLGQFLVRKGYLSAQDLDRAMSLQTMRFRSLGAILAQMELVDPEIIGALLGEMNSADRPAEGEAPLGS
jgi:adsorption protein B